jgi:hypothetical protein
MNLRDLYHYLDDRYYWTTRWVAYAPVAFIVTYRLVGGHA